ncbi:hypothetical protein T484DRAFT_2019585 [Baffinella frigidus]|nr:hypothetical protein T484DRAFT_2019585 [Cryptophyta sp. CCMP2293]
MFREGSWEHGCKARIARNFASKKREGWLRVLEVGERDKLRMSGQVKNVDPLQRLSRKDARGRSTTPKCGNFTNFMSVPVVVTPNAEVLSPERNAESLSSEEEKKTEEDKGSSDEETTERGLERGRTREARGRSLTFKKISSSMGTRTRVPRQACE